MAQESKWVEPQELSKAIGAAYARSGRPSSVHLDITYRCDLDCQHCYLDDRKTYPELTTAEWLSTLDQLAELGVWGVNFSGGEVFLRPDTLTLVARAKHLGMGVSVRSHLGNVDAALARGIKEARVGLMRTTVYSMRAEVHDAFTRRPGSHAATLAGIAALLAQDVQVEVDVVVQSPTVEEIPALNAHFEAMGVKINFGTSIYRDHYGREALDLLDLTPAERVRARQLIWSVKSEDVDIHATVAQRAGQGTCGAGRSQFYIAPDGSVWPCVMFPMQMGHLREHRLVDIWDHSPERQSIVRFNNSHRDACQTCAGSEVCFYCAGEAYKTTGDFRNPPAHFHSRTRDLMRGLELARGPRYSEADWASVPEGSAVRTKRPGKFVFPIYRPTKGRSARVGQQP